MDWWGLVHKLMAEFMWPPDTIGRLTPTQVLALSVERPPAPGITTPTEFEAMMEAREIERQAWER